MYKHHEYNHCCLCSGCLIFHVFKDKSITCITQNRREYHNDSYCKMHLLSGMRKYVIKTHRAYSEDNNYHCCLCGDSYYDMTSAVNKPCIRTTDEYLRIAEHHINGQYVHYMEFYNNVSCVHMFMVCRLHRMIVNPTSEDPFKDI